MKIIYCVSYSSSSGPEIDDEETLEIGPFDVILYKYKPLKFATFDSLEKATEYIKAMLEKLGYMGTAEAEADGVEFVIFEDRLYDTLGEALV